MKKLLATLLVGVMTLSLLVGCSEPAQNETDATSVSSQTSSVSEDAPSDEAGNNSLTVGFSVITLNFPAYVTLQNGIISSAEAKGWEVIATEAGMDVEKTVNDCLDLLEEGVDALVIASWYGDSLGEVFEAAKAKNVPVFMIDTGGLPDEGYVTHIGAHDFNAGYAAGEWAAKYLNEEKGLTTIDYICFTTPTTVGRNRADGFLEGLESNTNVTVNFLEEYNGDSRESYMATCEDALVAYPNIDLIYSISAQGGLGAYDACVAAEREEVHIIGFDNEKDESDLIAAGTQYIASVDQLRAGQAELTIQSIEDYLFNGKEFEIFTEYPVGLNTVEGMIQ